MLLRQTLLVVLAGQYLLAVVTAQSAPLEKRPAQEPLQVADRGLSTADIQVLVIASEARDDWRLQADTWLRHFPHYIATEKHTPKCKICGTPDNTPHKGSLFEGALFFGDRFHGRPLDWYCAQQRPMQALNTVLTTEISHLPKWLLIIDDDTIVNPRNLLRMLSEPAQLHNERVVFGNRYRGGAGFLLSQGTLKNLTQQVPVTDMAWDKGSKQWQFKESSTKAITACVDRLLGGTWCYMHSDHAMWRCATSLGVAMIDKGVEMEQNCPVGTKLLPSMSDKHEVNKLRNAFDADAKTQAWLRDIMVTCHHMDKESTDSIYKLVRSTWDQA